MFQLLSPHKLSLWSSSNCPLFFLLQMEILKQIPIFHGFPRSLKKIHIFQPRHPKYFKYAEEHLSYLSHQIIFVGEEIARALLKGRQIPRKPTHWVKEATAFKRQVSDALKELQNSKNSSLKSEELKHMCEQISDYLKHCPVECKFDKPITFGTHEIEDTKLSRSKSVQGEDHLEDQDVEMKLIAVNTSVPTAGCTERDDTVAVGNKSKVVLFPDSYPASIPELSCEDKLNSESMSGGKVLQGSASSQAHDAFISEISHEGLIPYISESQIEKRHESEITEEVGTPEYMVRERPSFPGQEETGSHRRHEKMPIGELASSSESVLEFLTSEKNQSELETETSYSSHAEENKHHDESVAGPTQTVNESDLGVIIPIALIGKMSMSVELRFKILSTSSSNNSFGLDPEKDNYLFSATEKLIKLELDNQRILMEGQEPSGTPETFQANGALLPEDMIVNRSGCRSKEMPKVDEWRQAGVVNLSENNFLSLNEEPHCPNLVLLFLQRNNLLTRIHSSFFDRMPALQVVDLSNTRIRTLPSSLFLRTKLQVLMARNCLCLDSLPPEVKNLRNMKVLDLSGTDLYCLPKEIDQLTQLRHLHLSFYGPDYGIGYARFPSELVSPSIISKLQALQELSIVVHPEDQRWIKIAGDIVQHVGRLKDLSYLQFYFPTVEAVKSFIEVSPSWSQQRLKRFKLVVGRDVKRIISRVPDEVESKYNQQDRRLRFVNGNEVPEAVKTVLKPVTAFYLDHHIEIQSLSEFDISNFKELKFCVVRECPNIQVMIIGEDRSESAFPNLEYLGMHYLWELERIWEDPVPAGSFNALKYLRVYTCPKIEYIASQSMLECLVNLESFFVEDCESLKSIVKENKTEKYGATLLPRLTELVLRHLPQLETLGSGLCPSEQTISIHCCPKLNLSPHLGRVKQRKLLGSTYNCSSFCICG